MTLPLTPYGLRELLIGTAVSAAAITAALVVLPSPWVGMATGTVGVLWLYLLAFFRDPHRVVPPGDDLLLAPADGVVTDVTALDTAEFVDGPALRVGIFLSVFDVHVNRMPCGGRVAHLAYHPGAFLDARDPQATSRNESNTIGLVCPQWGDARVVVRQIAGLIARRIVCPLRLGETLAPGQRFGMIKFGSRTELIVPVSLGFEAAITVGQRVYGGTTILGRVPTQAVPERPSCPGPDAAAPTVVTAPGAVPP